MFVTAQSAGCYCRLNAYVARWEPWMLHIVEVPLGAAGLTLRTNAMREWLDHQHFEPSGFRFAAAADQEPARCRVLFEDGAHAEAFAKEFGGRLLRAATIDGSPS